MEELIQLAVGNKAVIGLVGFMALEKFVRLSSWKWDDLIIDSIKEVMSIKKGK